MPAIPPITPNEVIMEANTVYRTAAARLTRSEELCHKRGFPAYATAIANMRTDFEKAMLRLTEALEEPTES